MCLPFLRATRIEASNNKCHYNTTRQPFGAPSVCRVERPGRGFNDDAGSNNIGSPPSRHTRGCSIIRGSHHACSYGVSDTRTHNVNDKKQVKWVNKGVERGETLVSISTDGRVVEWSMKKGLSCSPLMVLKRIGEASAPPNERVVRENHLIVEGLAYSTLYICKIARYKHAAHM